MRLLIVLALLAGPCWGRVTLASSTVAIGASASDSKATDAPPRPISPPAVPADTSLVGQYIRIIFQDSKGNLWFGPAGPSVARYDGSKLTYYSNSEFFRGSNRVDQEFGNSVHAMAEDRQGNVWFGTHHGAIKWDGTTFRHYGKAEGLGDLRVGRKSMLVDKAGTLWVGTAAGAFRYEPTADSTCGKCFLPFDPLAPIAVTGLMEDRIGNIWFASEDSGVFRYDGQAITNIREREGLGDNYAGGMIQDGAGNYWFTMKGGICRYDGHAFTDVTVADGLGGSEVWGLYMERSGVIWVSARGSTTRFDPSLGIADPRAFTVFTVADGINCCVQSMYQDRAGNMWWGSGDGVHRFDGRRFYQVRKNGPWQ